MKIVVVGLGYVGMSNAVLLAQNNEVVGVDVSQQRVDAVNERKSPIVDNELSLFLAEKQLNLRASTDLQQSIVGAKYVIVSTPTDYNEEDNYFDTTSVEAVIAQVIKNEPGSCIVIKSTIPIGFVENIRKKLKTDAVIFSPEFLREGRALYDNLYPSRIVIGEKSRRAKVFADLQMQGAIKENIDLLLTGSREAEAIKLFANSHLAMRVAFFNELDTFALTNEMNSREIIDGVSLDPRIGSHYNNPSFGYGGYCLPKDTKQLLANFNLVPQNIMSAIVESNSTRKIFLANQIIKKCPKVVGIYRLAMKTGSDNFRDSSIQDIIKILKSRDIEIIIYEPDLDGNEFLSCSVEKEISVFKERTDIILANRMFVNLSDVKEKLFTRDIFGSD